MLLLLLLGASQAAPAADKIASLPGWDAPLPSDMYSGYVNVTASADREMLVHYWYIEAEAVTLT